MSTYSQTLTSHGEILANIPGILGFYPQNALILAFIVDDEGVDTLRLGSVAQFDLDEAVEKLTESRDRFPAWTNHLELDAAIAYVIRNDMAQPIFDETATYLTSGALHLPPLLGVVQVPEIVSGAAWWSVHRHRSSTSRATALSARLSPSMKTFWVVSQLTDSSVTGASVAAVGV